MTLTRFTANRKLFFSGVGICLATGALLALAIPNASHIITAAARVHPWIFALTLVLGVAALLLRSEVWRTCLEACGGETKRPDLYAANSFGMLGNAINHYVGPAVRVGTLRKIEPDSSPRPCQMFAADLPVLLTEASLATILFATAVGAAGFPWWLPVAVFGGICFLLSGLWTLRRRLASKALTLQGLNIMSSRVHMKRMIICISLAVAFQVIRTWLLLDGVGLHPAFWQVVMTFCATGVLGVLPLGPATSSGATLAVFSAQSTTAAAAAGMLLTGTAFAAAILFAIWGGIFLLRRSFRKAKEPVVAQESELVPVLA